MELLKKIVYFSGTYSFEGLRNFYAAWLRLIEKGVKCWSDDSQILEQAILSKHLLRDNVLGKKPVRNYGKSNDFKPKNINVKESSENVWFCANYNRNKCLHKADHTEVIRGRMHYCQHICAECWLKDGKKQKHPECSKDCPHCLE